MDGILFSSFYFQKWKELNRLKPNTVQSYISRLKFFEDYLGLVGWEGELDFDKFYYSKIHDKYAPIDLDFMDGYIEYLRDNKTRSIAKCSFIALKSFMDLLVDYDLIEFNPLRHYKNPFYYESFRNRALSEEECLNLLKAAYELDPFFQQYYLILLLQTTCGLRATELCRLTVSQIDFEHNVIVIDNGRKTKIGTVRMTDALQKKLREYMNHPFFIAWTKGKDKELFFWKNKPFTPTDLNKLLNNLRMKAKITRKVTNHDLRATMAYLLYKEGNDYKSIQKQLRHKKLKTTLGYLPIHVELNGYLD
ncbi:tyrosine-type recombinase/integrase [Bacillus marasmi]|uniref:tyrosine-type recombinase/integrase n=1 Tax=Bacillus marasmi TaxID=1926279 RepID=UPI0011CA6BB4|nr:site-specific integrase [Bacillus marasmi]